MLPPPPPPPVHPCLFSPSSSPAHPPPSPLTRPAPRRQTRPAPRKTRSTSASCRLAPSRPPAAPCYASRRKVERRRRAPGAAQACGAAGLPRGVPGANGQQRQPRSDQGGLPEALPGRGARRPRDATHGGCRVFECLELASRCSGVGSRVDGEDCRFDAPSPAGRARPHPEPALQT